LWNGEELHGDRILLYSEQGLGDTLQMVRLAPEIVKRGGRVTLLVQPELRTLLAGIPGAERVVTYDEKFPKCAWRCSLMSLPHRLELRLDTILSQVPYVGKHLMGCRTMNSQLRVGFAWAGNRAHFSDSRRSLASVQQLQPLFDLKDISFISLQKDAAAAQLDELITQSLNIERPDLPTFQVTAETIASLDLVVSVDTSVAHLAGSMGKPVWILIGNPPDWRWLRDRRDSPWYPTATLFRQPVPGDWGTPVRQIAERLEKIRDSSVIGSEADRSATPGRPLSLVCDSLCLPPETSQWGI
jgi:hypothetical protein